MLLHRFPAFVLRLLRWLASAAALLAMVAGLPWALVRFIGWPLPHQVPSLDQVRVTLGHPLTGTMLQGILACLVWVLWASFLVAVITEVRYTARGLHAPRIRLLSPVQAIAALLVAGLSITPAAGAVLTVPAMTPPPPAITATLEVMPPPSTAPAAHPPVPATDTSAVQPMRLAAQHVLVQAGDQHYTYAVERGDTLWHIAATWLGNPLRWPEIYQLNRDHYDQHGRMHAGDHIEPGWVLVLPDDATPPAGTHAAPPPTRSGPPSPRQTPPGPSTPSSPSTPSAAASPSATASPATTQPATPTPTGPAGALPSPATSGTGSAAASPSPTAHAPSPSRSPRANPPGISLPGGSWVDLGLAAAITAAAALVWIQRRRRYTPRPPSPTLRLDDPDLAPMPTVVTRVRRGVREAFPPASPLTDVEADEADETVSELASAAVGAEPPAPVTPALDHPLSQVWPPAGLGLVGAGAEAAGRGFLVAALASGGFDEPEGRSRVVIPAATLATLLGAEAVGVGETTRLTITAGLPEALEVLETATLHRTRLVYDHEVDNVAALRDDDPLEEPLPPLLLIADATTAHQRARIAALLTQGQRLDIHGVLLGDWEDGNTVDVAANGTTTPAEGDAPRHGAHSADVGRLAVLNPTETAELLRTLAEAHTGQPQPGPPQEQPQRQPAPDAAPDDDTAHNEKKGTPARPSTAAHNPTVPASHADRRPDRAQADLEGTARSGVVDPSGTQAATTGGSADDAGRVPADPHQAGVRTGEELTGDQIAGRDQPLEAERIDAEDAAGPDGAVDGGLDDEDAAGAGRARVSLFGAPRIANLPPPTPGDPPLRPQSMQLLVYLAVHGGRAGRDQILEDLLGDAPRKRAPHRLNTYVYNLRVNLKRAGGPATYVGPPDQGYPLNRDALDIDLWNMQAAIAEADTATDAQTRIDALRRAVACCTGPLAEGRDYPWIEPYREAVRQQAIDAHLALVAALADTRPQEAVQVLHAAIGHDPYAEPLYQQAMRLHARLRDVQAIRDLRRALTRRLADIDAEPGDDTLALADQLVADLQRRPRQPRPLRGDVA